MKKIVFITQALGGVETSLLLIFKFLARTKYEPHLICPPQTTLTAKAASYGVLVHPVKMVRTPHPVRDVASLFSIIKILKEHSFDIIHAQSAKAGFLARLACKVVRPDQVLYSPRAFSYLSQRGLLYKLFLFLERRAVTWTDMLIATSESEKVRAISEVHYDERNVVVVRNSVDPDDFNTIRMNNHQPREKLVLTIGRLGYQKNPMMFLDLVELMCAQRNDVKFVMQGGGFLGHLEEKVTQRILNSDVLRNYCELLPWSDHASTKVLYERCSVFVLSSRFEGMPNTLLEAMMYGKPVVATDVDGSRDVVVHGVTGFLVDVGATETMARYVMQLLDDDDLRAGMGKAARLWVQNHFLADANVRRLEEIYDRYLVREPPSGMEGW
ncbi:MAG: glycosyltransferase [Ignavibacteriae bacterium]|nr:glycosyltransferase [Ignavibacteriota bacterium]